MLPLLIVFTDEVSSLVHPDQEPEDCLVSLNDSHVKGGESMLVSLHIKGVQRLPSKFDSGYSMQEGLILDLSLV